MRYRLRIFTNPDNYVFEAYGDVLTILQEVSRLAVRLVQEYRDDMEHSVIWHEWVHMSDTSCGGQWRRFHPATN